MPVRATIPFVLLFAAAPLLPAAPVPAGANRPVFGATGLLNKADLDRIPFNCREDREAQEGHARGIQDADFAVYVPWDRFHEGEAIPAYFVVKNRGEDTVGLGFRFDFFERTPAAWNAGKIELRERKTGKLVGGFDSGCRLGGGPRANLPEGSYFAIRADLSRRGEDGFLPPGEYELTWAYARKRTEPARFTVLPADGDRPKRKAEPDVARRFLHLSASLRRALEEGRDRIVLKRVEIEAFEAGDFAAGLASGVGGKWAPDIRTIPATDGVLVVSAAWKADARGDTVTVSLRSADPTKRVELLDLPSLYLQIEQVRTKEDRGLQGEEKMADLKRKAIDLRTPLAFEVQLPRNWRKRHDIAGKFRVAVLVASEEVRVPRGELEKHAEEERKSTPDSLIWSGVLRTAFVEVGTEK